jgi:hypothetical protein
VTSSRLAVRRGRQEPRVLLRPEFDSEDDAQDAIALMATCGQDLDPFQVLLVLITLASIGGKLSASEVGALVARQNGKGGWLEAIAIWSLFEPFLYGELSGRKNTTLWTAHELKTSDEAYTRVKALIEANPELSAEVVVWNGGLSGTHIIQLRDGSRLVFLARSKSSGRGFSPRRIIFDEAQEFSTLAFRAMMYATSAQGARRQLIYAGTVPSAENDSAIWTGVRDRGRAMKPGGKLAWAEWTPEGSDNPRTVIDPTDWKVRAWANPALGARILASTIDEEWEAAQADLDGFLRERLSVWPSVEASTFALFGEGKWEAIELEDGDRPIPGAIGIALSIDRAWISIGSCGAWDDGSYLIGAVERRRHGEMVLVEPEDEFEEPRRVPWVALEAKRIQDAFGCAVVIDGRGPASDLIQAVADEGVDVITASTDDYLNACSNLFDAVGNGEATHMGDDELQAAVGVAVVRDVGDRWAWGRRKSVGDVSILEAVTLAWFARDMGWIDVGDSVL